MTFLALSKIIWILGTVGITFFVFSIVLPAPNNLRFRSVGSRVYHAATVPLRLTRATHRATHRASRIERHGAGKSGSVTGLTITVLTRFGFTIFDMRRMFQILF